MLCSSTIAKTGRKKLPFTALQAALGFRLTKGTVPHTEAELQEENRQQGRMGINKTAGNV